MASIYVTAPDIILLHTMAGPEGLFSEAQMKEIIVQHGKLGGQIHVVDGSGSSTLTSQSVGFLLPDSLPRSFTDLRRMEAFTAKTMEAVKLL